MLNIYLSLTLCPFQMRMLGVLQGKDGPLLGTDTNISNLFQCKKNYGQESFLDTLTNTNFSKTDIVKLAHHEAVKMYEFRVTCNFGVNEQ